VSKSLEEKTSDSSNSNQTKQAQVSCSSLVWPEGKTLRPFLTLSWDNC